MPSPKKMAEAMQEFVDRVERGEVHSSYTYAKFKAILAEPDTEEAESAGSDTPRNR